METSQINKHKVMSRIIHAITELHGFKKIKKGWSDCTPDTFVNYKIKMFSTAEPGLLTIMLGSFSKKIRNIPN